MVTSRSAATARPRTVVSRRRGPVLERAILDAALEQLSTVGWNGLTMEGVAAGAQTGKAAVYRRWPSKEDLVADALAAGLSSLEDTPDLGGIRDDLYALTRLVRDAMYSRPGFALRAVLHECDPSSSARFHALIMNRVVEPSADLFEAVVRRGVRRGDVRPDATGALVFDLIPAVLMYRSKVRGSEWPDEEIARLIDEVMLPLLRLPAR